MVIQELLDEYLSNLKGKKRVSFQKKLKSDTAFHSRATDAIKKYGELLALLTALQRGVIQKHQEEELDHLVNTCILDLKQDPEEIVEMKLFYLEIYTYLIGEAEDPHIAQIVDGKVQNIISAIQNLKMKDEVDTSHLKSYKKPGGL